MSDMFRNNFITTIYVSELWNTSNVVSSNNMFKNASSIVGVAGTAYSTSNQDVTYARIDNPPDEPGYLTDVRDKPSN